MQDNIGSNSGLLAIIALDMASADMLGWDGNFSGALTLARFYIGILLFCQSLKGTQTHSVSFHCKSTGHLRSFMQEKKTLRGSKRTLNLLC